MDEVENASMTTVAMAAIQSKDLQTLSKCLDQSGIDELWNPSSSISLLEYAVEENFFSAVSLLFSKVPSGPPYNDVIMQALVLAMRKNFKDIVKLFLDGALNGRLEMPLFDIFTYAIHKDLEDIAARVMKRSDFDLNCEEFWDGEHPLSVAIFKRCFHLVDLLIKSGAIIDAPNNKGETALVTACRLQFQDCCRTLLLHGANPNHRPLLGLSPLSACCSFSKDLQTSKGIVDLLLNAGLNINRESWIHKTSSIDSEFYDALSDLGRQPQSLKLLCCVRIREHMTYAHRGVSIFNFLSDLPLPTSLKNYVTLRDENVCVRT